MVADDPDPGDQSTDQSELEDNCKDCDTQVIKDAQVGISQENPSQGNSNVKPPISNKAPKHIQKQVHKKRPWLKPNHKPSKDEVDNILKQY